MQGAQLGHGRVGAVAGGLRAACAKSPSNAGRRIRESVLRYLPGREGEKKRGQRCRRPQASFKTLRRQTMYTKKPQSVAISQNGYSMVMNLNSGTASMAKK